MVTVIQAQYDSRTIPLQNHTSHLINLETVYMPYKDLRLAVIRHIFGRLHQKPILQLGRKTHCSEKSGEIGQGQ